MAASAYSTEEIERLGTSPQRGDDSMRQDFSPDGRKAVWYSRTLSPYDEQSMNCSYGSLEAYGGDEMNRSTNILQELQEVHSQNQKLREANADLRSRLETTEETCSELQRKAEEANENIDSLQQKQKVCKEQMSELREEYKRLSDNYFHLQSKETELEKEKQLLVKNLREYQSEESHSKLTWRKAVASLEDEIERLKMEIEFKDINIKKIEEHTDELIDKLLEENKNYSELHSSHKELQKAYQAMKIEVADLERTKMTPVKGSFGQDLNKNLLSELRTELVNEDRGPSPVCGRVSFETIEGLTMVEDVSGVIERIMTQSQSHPELLEKGEDMRNRFASLATSALMSDRSSTSPLAGRGAMETCKEGDSDKFSDVKKKLTVSISSNNNQSTDAAPISPTKSLTPPPLSPSSPSSSSPPLLSSTPLIVRGDGEGKGSSGGGGSSGERSKTEEEIFQQGFEQGVRSQISQELDDLRDQQRALCENLEEIMEAAEDEDEDENEKNSETQPMLKMMQQYCKNIQWSKASRIGRLLLTGTLFILALISIITLVLPLERCSGGANMLSSSWEEVVRVLGPYTNIYHPRPPPI